MRALVLVIPLLMAAGVSAAEVSPETLVSVVATADKVFRIFGWWTLIGVWFCVMWSWVATNNKRGRNDY